MMYIRSNNETDKRINVSKIANNIIRMGLPAYNSTTTPSRSKLSSLQNTDRKSYVASQTQSSRLAAAVPQQVSNSSCTACAWL